MAASAADAFELRKRELGDIKFLIGVKALVSFESYFTCSITMWEDIIIDYDLSFSG